MDAGCGYTFTNCRGVRCGERLGCGFGLCHERNYNHQHFLTVTNRTDSFALGKELVGENGSIDRILRRLKLHAEGRQFGGQNS
jgi:hypothetical protein